MTEHKTKNEDNKPKLSAENRLVFNEVARYLEGGDKLSDYAIMLSGAWGIGKTYFLKNFIYPLIQDNTSRLSEFYPENENGKSSDIVKGLKSRRPIYISLAGINSFDRLNELLQIQAGQFLHPERIDSVEAQARRLELLAKEVEDLSGSHYLNLDKDKDVLCFDDLERIDPDFMEEALGYINTYIEHQHIKTIFLCNEDEIGRSEKVQYYENELDRFKTDESIYNKILNESHTDINKNQVVIDFKAKVEEEKNIYQLNIARFKKIKEKYIRVTLPVSSQIVYIIESDSLIEIKNNQKIIIEVFHSENIRTWFYTRDCIEKVLKIINNIEGVKEYAYIERIKTDIIKQICISGINKKDGKIDQDEFFPSFLSIKQFVEIDKSIDKKDEKEIIREIDVLNNQYSDEELTNSIEKITGNYKDVGSIEQLKKHIDVFKSRLKGKKRLISITQYIHVYSFIISYAAIFEEAELYDSNLIKEEVENYLNRLPISKEELLFILNNQSKIQISTSLFKNNDIGKKYNQLFKNFSTLVEGNYYYNGSAHLTKKRILDAWLKASSGDLSFTESCAYSYIQEVFTKTDIVSIILVFRKNIDIESRNLIYKFFEERYDEYGPFYLQEFLKNNSELPFMRELKEKTQEYLNSIHNKDLNDIPLMKLVSLLDGVIKIKEANEAKQ